MSWAEVRSQSSIWMSQHQDPMTFTRVKNLLTDGGEDCSCVTIKFSFTHAIYAYLKVLSLFFSHLKHDFQDMSNNASFFCAFFLQHFCRFASWAHHEDVGSAISTDDPLATTASRVQLPSLSWLSWPSSRVISSNLLPRIMWHWQCR